MFLRTAPRPRKIAGLGLLLGILGIGTVGAFPLRTGAQDNRPLHVDSVFLKPEGQGLWVTGSVSKDAIPAYVQATAHIHVRILDRQGKVLWDKPDSLNTYILNYPPREGGLRYLSYVVHIDKVPAGAARVLVVCHTDGHVHSG